jgi:hypothetical protein
VLWEKKKSFLILEIMASQKLSCLLPSENFSTGKIKRAIATANVPTKALRIATLRNAYGLN